jgi:hypothetical protein
MEMKILRHNALTTTLQQNALTPLGLLANSTGQTEPVLEGLGERANLPQPLFYLVRPL